MKNKIDKHNNNKNGKYLLPGVHLGINFMILIILHLVYNQKVNNKIVVKYLWKIKKRQICI